MEWHNSLLTYIDILGFRDYVDKAEKDFRNPQMVHDVLVKLRVAAANQPGEEEHLPIRFVAFSDTIVRTIDMGFKTLQPRLFHFEINRLARVQAALIQSEVPVLIRGAIVFEPVYHDAEYLHGPGLILAHDLEREAAIFPRIIIDNPIIEDWFRERMKLPGAQFPDPVFESWVRKDFDGWYFVDYLGTAIMSSNSNEDTISLLTRHRDVIQNGARQAEFRPRLRSKYNWLTSYHNAVVREREEELSTMWNGRGIDDLLVRDASGN